MTFSNTAAIESAERVRKLRARRQAVVCRLHEQRDSFHAPANLSMEMVISDWNHDEFGNPTRTIRATETHQSVQQ